MRQAILALALVLSLAAVLRADEPAPIRVMSYNIRYGTASDGENHWQKRKAWLAETIREFKPDLLGTQETLAFQRDYLKEQLVGYEAFGVGRDDGAEQGEMMALYYKASRFERLAGGHFWLSETPDTPGSKSWDSSLPRMASWVRLRDSEQPAQAILFVNTHFDHRGPMARLEGSKLLRKKLEELGRDCAIVVTGDFNAGERSEPYQALFARQRGLDSPVVDSYRAHHPQPGNEEGTISGFQGGTTGGPRIDWIGLSPGWTIDNATILRPERDGRTPSDHHPVAAIVRWASQGAKE